MSASPITGFCAFQRYPPGRLQKLIQDAERWGYQQLWYSNHKLERDLWVGLAASAFWSQTLELGSFIAEPYSYHPGLIAAAAASLDELSGGRMVIGLGAGGANFNSIGLARESPLTAMGECIAILRSMLAGKPSTVAGKIFSTHKAQLPSPPERSIPIILATRGRRMLELAGKLADGVMISNRGTPGAFKRALAHVRRGCGESGRQIGDLQTYARIDLAIAPRRSQAINAVKPMLLRQLLTSWPDTSFLDENELVVPPRLRSHLSTGKRVKIEEIQNLIPSEYVRELCWAGTPDDVGGFAQSILDIGIRRITIVPHAIPGQRPENVIASFGQEIMPYLQVRNRTDTNLTSEIQ